MATRSITIGQYIPGDSFLHHLDPRAKLVSLFLFILAIFTVNNIPVFIPFLLLIITLYAVSRIPFRLFLRGIRPILYITILTFILHILFTGGGEVVFRYGALTIETAGIETGLFTVFRLILLVFYTLLVTLTTTPLSLTGGLEYFFRPLGYFKVPVSDIAMILTISLRFIPTLIEESQRIAMAQMARGADLKSGSIFRRIRFLVPIIVPLFISAFRRADELAVAMESRCYRVGIKRTRMKEFQFKIPDYGVIAVSALVVTALFLGQNL